MANTVEGGLVARHDWESPHRESLRLKNYAGREMVCCPILLVGPATSREDVQGMATCS